VRASLDRVLTWALAIVLVAAAVGTVAIAVDPPRTTEPLTEFYVLTSDGEAIDYPANLSVGEETTVIVGVGNQERQATEYTVVARLGDRVVAERSVELAVGESREFTVTFAAREPGDQRLRLLLYRGAPSDSTESYRDLRVLLNVTAGS
jgi:uncharacterized membrane protein